MNTTSIGRSAEAAAAQYLKRKGYKVRDLNWRTRWCEIDIVAEKDDIIYFVEVKYRRSTKQGGGLVYVTPTKLRRMSFAAQLWMSRQAYDKAWELSAIELSGEEGLQVRVHLPSLT